MNTSNIQTNQYETSAYLLVLVFACSKFDLKSLGLMVVPIRFRFRCQILVWLRRCKIVVYTLFIEISEIGAAMRAAEREKLTAYQRTLLTERLQAFELGT